ncbi:T9SS type A sorting domain-containing protein [Psychroserpens mesophilus]|uniref:T9SS type A sorting domain-containing protein n=1 Tax=Psychroserpens mesophilus TaxID=325473 RepID=UPI003D64A91A
MKIIYNTLFRNIVMTVTLFSVLSISAQDIHFTFGNPQNTNDGTFDYFEVDVFIQTIHTTGSFKLGSGQLYFNYNPSAFGTHVFNNSNFEVTNPSNEGYIAGQFMDEVNSELYGNFTINDNKMSRVSWSFFQKMNASAFFDDNVSAIPTKLCHLKFKYSNVNEDPMLRFEDGDVYDDQFIAVCKNLSDDVFCAEQVGLELINDTFDSSGARFSSSEIESQSTIKLYPNPVKNILNIEGDLKDAISLKLYALSGQLILELKDNFNSIDMNKIEAGVYVLKLLGISGINTFKVVKE